MRLSFKNTGIFLNCQGGFELNGKQIPIMRGSWQSAPQYFWPTQISSTMSHTLCKPFNHLGIISFGQTKICRDLNLFVLASLNCSIAMSATAGGGDQIHFPATMVGQTVPCSLMCQPWISWPLQNHSSTDNAFASWPAHPSNHFKRVADLSSAVKCKGMKLILGPTKL